MENRIVNIPEERVRENAEKRFIATCGFKLETSRKHQRMMEMGLKVRETGVEGINIRATYLFLDKSHYRDGKVVLNDSVLTCNYFGQIPEEAVEGMYLYMLTSGECLFSSEEQIMDFLYADIWGTNYVDAGIDAFKEDYILPDMAERFSKPGKPVFLSEEFGPGYFGMPVIETKKFVSLLDSDAIGVRVKESGLMIPQKSCAGLFLVYNRDDLKAEPGCVKCLGNSQGCAFCSFRTA